MLMYRALRERRGLFARHPKFEYPQSAAPVGLGGWLVRGISAPMTWRAGLRESRLDLVMRSKQHHFFIFIATAPSATAQISTLESTQYIPHPNHGFRKNRHGQRRWIHHQRPRQRFPRPEHAQDTVLGIPCNYQDMRCPLETHVVSFSRLIQTPYCDDDTWKNRSGGYVAQLPLHHPVFIRAR